MGMTMHFENGKKIEYDEEFDKKFITLLREMEELNLYDYKPSEKRIEQCSSACAAMIQEFGDQCDVVLRKGALSKDGYFIVARAKNLTIKHPKRFVENVLRLADNFETTSNLDGTVEFSVGFYGMVERVGE